ncbi:LLM class flavin-dependent oxidoreductase [Amycolatopsis roodepoortensis]|nr:LLM class flavin-dependent oxidoreductase [Amycolatopsis roodepoortensis]UUV28622.1 LLM class flavin-dependent oxidoreductase [Amycolatopsis roodepoortensis]
MCAGRDVHEVASMAAAAERAGFASVWAADFYDRSAVVAVAAMAAATENITLGTGIAYGSGRTPLVLAAEARDLDTLSGGRLILGLGTGTRRMQQDWHGLSGEHPAPRTEELIPLLRQLWRLDEGPVHHEGRFYRAHVVPTAPVPPPTRRAIPLYLAGVNARMVRAAGAVADGLVGHPLCTPEYLRHTVRPALQAGAHRAGRTEPVPVAGYVICAVDPDPTRAPPARRGPDRVLRLGQNLRRDHDPARVHRRGRRHPHRPQGRRPGGDGGRRHRPDDRHDRPGRHP